MRYTIDHTDEYFPEANLFAILVTNMNCLLAHKAAQTTIRDLVSHVNESQGQSITGQISDSPLSDPYTFWDPKCADELHLHCTLQYQAYLTDHNVPQPQAVEFSLEPYSGPGPTPNGVTRLSGRGAPLEEVYTSYVCYLIGGAFERTRDQIEAKFGATPSSWPVELQFFRHLRNASFHGNDFDIRPFRGAPQIDPANPPAWNGYVLPSDSAVNGTKAVNELLRIPHTLLFFRDMGGIVA